MDIANDGHRMSIIRSSSKFKYEEKLACHKPQLVHYHERDYLFDSKKRSDIMSGPLIFVAALKTQMMDIGCPSF